MLSQANRTEPTGSRSQSGVRALVATLLIAACSLPGCSFFFVQPPPPEPMWPRMPDASCTTSRFWPAIDAVTALAQLGQGVLVDPFGTSGRSAATTDEKIATGVGFALWGISAVVGFARTGRCDDYNRFVRTQTWQPAPGLGAQPSGLPRGWEPPEQRPMPVAPPNQPDDPGDAPPAYEAYPPAAAPSPGAAQGPAPDQGAGETAPPAGDGVPGAGHDAPPAAAPTDGSADPESR